MAALIGLLGGTFDPVHNGHLAIARHLRADLDMHSVRFLINAVPPHRTPPACPVEHRLAMLQSALAGDEHLVVDTRELHRTGPSYSVWTLRSLRRSFPDAALCWIIGADAWLGLRSWFRWQELSSLTHFLVVRRPGWDLDADAVTRLSHDKAVLRRRTAGAAVLCDAPQVDISASGIRERIAAGQTAADSLPEPVWSHIKGNRLYGFQPSTP